MAILKVLTFPNTSLRAETQPVTVFDDKLKRLASDMRETMLAHKGVGLAAPQIGIDKKLIVVEWEEHRFTMANPEIIAQEGSVSADEGCLSFPGIYESVSRPSIVTVSYQDENGEPREITGEGFLARIFAHEIDHLGGRLLIDNLSPLKRTFLRKKMERRARS